MTAGAIEEGKLTELPVSIRHEEVLHFLGYPEGQAPAERIERLMDDAICEARELVVPRGLFVRRPIEAAPEVGLVAIDASDLAIGLVTIGAELDGRVDELVASGAPTRALLLDAAGSAAVEEAADRLGALIAGESRGDAGVTPAARVSCRVSPGYGTWSIESQAAIFRVLPHTRLGVALLPTMLMTPRKSISFAMWLGADRRPLSGLSGCARCGLEHCRYRRTNKESS